jgi:RHS repeat-associated protein
MGGTGGTESYQLDAAGRLTSVAYADGTTIDFTYDPAGNRTGMTSGGTTTTYTYDAASQLTSAGSISYAYDPAGNRIAAGSASFGYDDFGNLASASAGATAISYASNGDGLRVSATSGGSTASYLWDQAAGLPSLLSDGTSGFLSADATLLAETSASGSAYPITDALGSVRALTDSSGSLGASASYDVFGSVRSSSGSLGSLGYTGALSDSSGLVYLQARSLDPISGTFTSRDPLTPGGPGTTGVNPYAYAALNPTTYTDPSGREALAEHGGTNTIGQVSRPSAQAAILGMAGMLLRVGLRLAFVLSLITGESCLLGGPCLLPRPWDDGIPQDDTRSLASYAETAAYLAQEMAIAIAQRLYEPDGSVARSPEVWRVVTEGYPFNWQPSARDWDGLSGALGGPAIPGYPAVPWNTDPQLWATRQLGRPLDRGQDRVMAADPLALMMMFSVLPSGPDYHVSIGGVKPGVRQKPRGPGLEWNVPPQISQKSVSRTLAAFFRTQVWP